MPKYFSDERPLPYERVDCCVTTLNRQFVEERFTENDAVTFCLSLPGLPESCLGYLVHVRRLRDGFEIVDMTARPLLRVESLDGVVKMLMHAAGIEIDDEIREQLLRVRDSSSQSD